MRVFKPLYSSFKVTVAEKNCKRSLNVHLVILLEYSRKGLTFLYCILKRYVKVVALLWSYGGINRNVEQTLLNMLVISQMMGDKSLKYPNLNGGNNYFHRT